MRPIWIQVGDRGGSEEPTQTYLGVRRGERRSDNEGIHFKANRYRKAKRPRIFEAFFCWLLSLERHDIDRAESFRTLVYVKSDRLTLSQRLEAVALDRGVMNEHIFAVFSCDKPES